jgi:hypothetical protein
VKAPCSLLPDVMPDTSAKAKPDPNADIILHAQHDDKVTPCTSKGDLTRNISLGHFQNPEAKQWLGLIAWHSALLHQQPGSSLIDRRARQWGAGSGKLRGVGVILAANALDGH